MAKQTWKPGNMLYPLPAVMVSVTDGEGKDNIITVAWAGTVCTNPPMVSISVRPSRYSYDMLCKTGEFVLNLTTEELAYATDYCGVRSGRDVDKFEKLHLTKEKADYLPEGFVIHQMRAEYKKQALLGDVFHPGVKKEEGKVVVSLSNESGEPYAVVEFTE